jgi:hypothetical protein
MPVKLPPVDFGSEVGRLVVIVRVLARVGCSVNREASVRLAETDGTGDKVTVVTPIVMLSCGV